MLNSARFEKPVQVLTEVARTGLIRPPTQEREKEEFPTVYGGRWTVDEHRDLGEVQVLVSDI
jgi:hypothetical protein